MIGPALSSETARQRSSFASRTPTVSIMADRRQHAWVRVTVAALCGFLASGQTGSQSEAPCLAPWLNVSAELGCLLFEDRTHLPWQQAQDDCHARQARLLEWSEWNSTEQYDVLNEVLSEIFSVTGTNSWWIGGTAAGASGAWVWASNSELLPSEFPWAPEQPDQDPRKKCLELQDDFKLPAEFEGVTSECTTARPRICQRVPPSRPSVESVSQPLSGYA